MAWVSLAGTAISAWAASQKKAGSGGLPEMGQSAGMFDTSGWNVATGGSRIVGSTASSGAKTQSPTQTPTVQPLPQYIDGGQAAGGGVDMTTILLVGGAALVLVVLVARKR